MKNTNHLHSLTVVLFTFFSFLFTSFDKERNILPNSVYQSGLFIVNEGSFGTPNGEISFFDRTTKTITNKLFETVNNRPLGGDVVQSMLIYQDKAYIVCNNSNKVEVTDANTFTSSVTIT